MSPPFPFESRASSFPNSFKRTFAPRVLQVVHVTGNRDVAALPDGLTPGHSPYQDWLYAARNPGSADGPSANDYVGRKGSTMELWDPETHVAWSNGDLKSPRLDLPGVKYLAGLRARGVNANKGCYREIELSGFPGSFDPTDEQIEVCAWFAATDSIKTGIDIVLHETILTHAYINTVDRQNCAFRPAIREARLKQLCERAIAIRAAQQGEPSVAAISTSGLTLTSDFELTIPSGSEVHEDAVAGSPLLGTYGGTFDYFGASGAFKAIRVTAPTGSKIGFTASQATPVKKALVAPDCKAAVNAALDHVLAPLGAVATAITEARPR